MKIKLQLSPLLSDIFISVYLFAFLFFRFQIESHFRDRYIISILFGGLTLLFLWVMVKKKFLNPNYFGLLKSKKLTRSQIRSKNKALSNK